jgi:pimeloyl-[acyl-carrier protein] methyl ester esterase
MHGTMFVSGWAHPVSDLEPLVRLLATPVVALDVHDHIERSLDKARPCDLIGWSMGALRAIEAASRKPGCVRRLVLISGTAHFFQEEGYPCGQPVAYVRGLRVGLRREPNATLADFFRFCALPAAIGKRALAQQVKRARGMKDASLLACLNDLMRADFRASVSKVSAPTLLLHGEQDAVIPASASRWLAGHLPHARLEIRAEAGHDLPARYPEWVADRVSAFLR